MVFFLWWPYQRTSTIAAVPETTGETMTNTTAMRWLGEVEDRILTQQPVTVTERIAAQVRRAMLSAQVPFRSYPTKRERQANKMAARRLRKLKQAKAEGGAA